MMLKEGAGVWWMGANRQGIEPKTWWNFKFQLAQEFKIIDEERIARDKLAKLRQLTSVQEYIKEFRILKMKISDLSEAEEFDKFRRGLKTEILNEMDRRRIKANIQRLMEATQEYDNLLFKQKSERNQWENSRNMSQGKGNLSRNPGFKKNTWRRNVNAIQDKDWMKELTCY